jgi:7-keto-8-aminopelargonate synthetase-like enzyme
LQANLAALGRGVQPSAIVPVIIGDESAAMQLSAQLLEEGYLIPAIRYPTVARGTARLRVTLSAAHRGSQVLPLAARLNAPI